MTSSTNNVADLVRIRPPYVDLTDDEISRVDKAPVAVTLARSREIDPHWTDDLSIPWKDHIQQLRAYLEASWTTYADTKDLDVGALIKNGFITEYDGSTKQGYFQLSGVDNKSGFKTQPAAAGCVLRHPIANTYFLVTKPANTPKLFTDKKASYDAAWQLIEAVELVSQSAETLAKEDVEELDLTAQAIVRRFAELDIYRDFAIAIDAKANEFLNKMQLETLDAALVQSLLTQYLSMRTQLKEATFAIEQLRDRAARLGYELITKQTGSIQKGSLTKTVIKTIKYRVGYLGRLPWGHSSHTILRRQAVREVVDIDFDVIEAKRNELEAEGFSVNILELGSNGYETANGETFAAILGRCNTEPGYRDKCVVFFPVYESGLTGNNVVTKYLLIKRPTASPVRVMTPRVFFEERYNYRLAWLGTELGPLLHSINLAPGESRKVTISATRSLERDVRESTAQSSDITEQQSTDLATEVEKETRAETERTSSLSWNVQASGSWGATTASGGASGSTSVTAKDYARALQKRTAKSAASVSRRYKQEVSSSVATKASTTLVDAVTSEFRNINEGRTLNLSFYQVNNRFLGRIYPDSLRLTIFPGHEAIAGTGIVIGSSAALTGDELRGVVESISDSLPPDTTESQAKHPPKKKLAQKQLKDMKTSVERKLVLAILQALLDEYVVESKSPDSIGTISDSNKQLAKIVKDMHDDPDTALDWNNISSALAGLQVLSTKPVNFHMDRLSIPSGAVYLDGDVGRLDTTEPYSEFMRARALRTKDADIAVRNTQAVLNLARAHAAESEPVIVEAQATSERSLSLVLQFPLPPGDWSLLHDEKEKLVIPLSCVGRVAFDLAWTEDQEWLSDVELAALAISRKTPRPANQAPTPRVDGATLQHNGARSLKADDAAGEQSRDDSPRERVHAGGRTHSVRQGRYDGNRAQATAGRQRVTRARRIGTRSRLRPPQPEV